MAHSRHQDTQSTLAPLISSWYERRCESDEFQRVGIKTCRDPLLETGVIIRPKVPRLFTFSKSSERMTGRKGRPSSRSSSVVASHAPTGASLVEKGVADNVDAQS